MGKIPARDLGDSRLTSYYFVFIANPGDIMLDFSVANFTGDLDVFTAGQLRPKTKVTIFPGMETWDTSRIVYSRQRERLIIRIEGRTPNDDPASFRIKLSGSFEPIPGQEIGSSEEPSVKSSQTGVNRVNSVGTKLEDDSNSKTENPSSTETKPEGSVKKETVARDSSRSAPAKAVPQPKTERRTVQNNDRKSAADPQDSRKNEADEAAKKGGSSKKSEPRERASRETAPSIASREAVGSKLIVEFKGGEKFVLPMANVGSITVSKGAVTLVTDDGKTKVFPLSEVLKMAIE